MQLTPDKVGKSVVFYRHRHVAFAFEKALSGQMFELVNICMDFFNTLYNIVLQLIYIWPLQVHSTL